MYYITAEIIMVTTTHNDCAHPKHCNHSNSMTKNHLKYNFQLLHHCCTVSCLFYVLFQYLSVNDVISYHVLKMQAVHEGYEKDEYGGQHDNNQNYWKQKVDFVPSILFTVM